MDKSVLLDGTAERQISYLKECFGLRPDQTFQDLDVGEDEEKDENGIFAIKKHPLS